MSKIEYNIDKQYITGIMQVILDKSHSTTEKKHIRVYDDHLEVACPICGDSHKHHNKKRGNLYFKNMMYICYNESGCSRTFTKLLKTFDIDIDPYKKLEIYEYLKNNTTFDKKTDLSVVTPDNFFTIDELISYFSNKSKGLSNIRPIQSDSIAYRYLRYKRKIFNYDNIFEGIYHFTDSWFQPVIIFLNKMGDRVLSIQVRNFLEKSNDKRFYKIYEYSELHSLIKGVDITDEQERITYDRLSHFYNIFNVNFDRQVHIFEGYLDSTFIPNSIGMTGTNTVVDFLIREDGVNLIFFYDNDKAGLKKTDEMLSKGQYVFLWNKFFIDIVKKKNNIDKIETLKKISTEITDMNDLCKSLKKPVYEIFDLYKYISNNEMDKIYLMDIDILSKMYL